MVTRSVLLARRLKRDSSEILKDEVSVVHLWGKFQYNHTHEGIKYNGLFKKEMSVITTTTKKKTTCA